MVANYVEFDLANPPAFGKGINCKYKGIDVQCGPRGLKGSGDSLFHNNGDGTFTNVTKSAGVDDPGGYYGLGVVWADFNNTGKPDIYVANDSTPSFLYRNEGKGKFAEIGLESGTALSEDGNEQASMGESDAGHGVFGLTPNNQAHIRASIIASQTHFSSGFSPSGNRLSLEIKR